MASVYPVRQRFSARYGARHPWLVPWPRAGIYLIWRGLISALRPALFLLCVAGAIYSALLAARDLPPPSPSPIPLERAFDEALYAAISGDVDRDTTWISGLDRALTGRERSIPDLHQARAIANAYVAYRGRDELAFALIAEPGQSRRQVEAQLRSMPAWQREHRLNTVLEDFRIEYGDGVRSTGYLALAPQTIRARYVRAERLYGPSLLEAEAWFVDPGGQVLALGALPGLEPRELRVYGDVRAVVVRGCALVQGRGQAVGQCRVGFLPKPAPDPVLAGLALAVAGAEPERVVGARLAKVAWAAGTLDQDLAQELAFGRDHELGEASVLASSMALMVDAGEVWTQPARFEAAARRASEEADRSGAHRVEWRNDVFDAFAALRREVGALDAIRLMKSVKSLEDTRSLVALAEVRGQSLLALHALTGDQLLASIDQGEAAHRRPLQLRDWPQRAQQFAALSISFGGLAILILGLSLYGAHRRKRDGRGGGLEIADAVMTRLILGRNS